MEITRTRQNMSQEEYKRDNETVIAHGICFDKLTDTKSSDGTLVIPATFK
jgi:hypothetical protein